MCICIYIYIHSNKTYIYKTYVYVITYVNGHICAENGWACRIACLMKLFLEVGSGAGNVPGYSPGKLGIITSKNDPTMGFHPPVYGDCCCRCSLLLIYVGKWANKKLGKLRCIYGEYIYRLVMIHGYERVSKSTTTTAGGHPFATTRYYWDRAWLYFVGLHSRNIHCGG